MTAYLPAFEFMPVRDALRSNTIQMQRGQWVIHGRAKGRLVALGKKLQVIYRMSGESFRSFVLRFKVAVYKVFQTRRPSPRRFVQMSLDLVPTSEPFYSHDDLLPSILMRVDPRFHRSAADVWRQGRSDAIESKPRHVMRFFADQYSYNCGYRVGLSVLHNLEVNNA